MSDIAIRLHGLSKQYRIGGVRQRYKTLRDTLADAVTAPLRAIRSTSQRSNGHETIWALKDVSLEVKRGEVVGIIGRNGAGKSTLLKILSRITEPTDGYAELRGRVGSLLEVGTGFHPELTGRENIYLNGAILGMKKRDIDRQFDAIVAFAEVEKFIDTAVKHYSSGMYLRLAFAVAAHLEPEILLVDEVLAVGDAAFQQKCLGKIGEVAKEGRTVLFVSHNMSAITSLTTRCIALIEGRLHRDGSSSDVIRKYLSDTRTAVARLSWDDPRPGDAAFEFVMCQVGIDGGEIEFCSDNPVDIIIEFQVKKRVQGLRVGFDLISHEGVLVFRTYHDDKIIQPEVFELGVYRIVCSIPANLLNQGAYFVTLRAGIHGVRRICVLEQVIRFSVTNLVGSNSQYGGSRPGVINPELHWSVSYP